MNIDTNMYDLRTNMKEDNLCKAKLDLCKGNKIENSMRWCLAYWDTNTMKLKLYYRFAKYYFPNA